MAKTFQFDITTPERTVFNQAVAQVSLPTSSGEITILPNHIPIVSLLVPGVLRIINPDGVEEILAVSGGFIEVHGSKVTVLADTAERADEIDEARAEAARKKAEQAMKDKTDTVKFTDAASSLERHLARLSAIRRRKQRYHRPKDAHTPSPIQE
ncbi:MAG: F0F1 ATP synthase subunit epsilon [bacterium]